MSEDIKELKSQMDRIEKLLIRTHTPDIMTIEECATYLRCNPGTVYRRKHEIGFTQRDRLILIEKKDVDKWLQNYKRKP